MKRWFLPAAARAREQSNELNREILASNIFNCCKEVINAPPVPSISRCIHIVYRHKNVSEYQWSNFIYNCMSTFLHYVHCKDALLDCSAPGGERCESLTRVDEIWVAYISPIGNGFIRLLLLLTHCAQWSFTSNSVWHFTKFIGADTLKNWFVPALEVNFLKKLPQLVALHIFQSSYINYG